MILSLVTAPSAEPVSLSEAKLHLRVDHEADDSLITRQVAAARQRVESFTSRALLPQTWRATLAAFPAGDEPFELPLPPLRSVTHVKYIDSAGTQQTWSSSEYTVEAPAGPWAERGRIYPKYGYSYPSPRCQNDAIEVEFVAGYATAAEVPGPLVQALLLRLGDFYERRESGIVGTIFTETKAEQLLMWPFRSMRAA